MNAQSVKMELYDAKKHRHVGECCICNRKPKDGAVARVQDFILFYCSGCVTALASALRKSQVFMRRAPKKPLVKSKPLRLRVEFIGEAADAIRRLHARGLHGPTVKLVVEGLALAELRRTLHRVDGAEMPIDGYEMTCRRCNDDGDPCSLCGAAGQEIVPCDPKTGDIL